jgi:AcrR family transcriptional regulator
VPCQERGERRVAGLLAAATGVIGEVGYDAATMSAIADRAGASIGSLYQFFPNKKAVARALCDSCACEVDALWATLKTRAAKLSLNELVKEYIGQMVGFVDGHPAFLSLADMPSSAFNPGMRERLRERLAQVLLSHAPRLKHQTATRIADVILQINKGLMSRYALAEGSDRKWVMEEFNAVLTGYLKSRLEG